MNNQLKKVDKQLKKRKKEKKPYFTSECTLYKVETIYI